MIRACIIDTATGDVVNVVKYDTVPEGTPPGFPEGHVALEHARADTTWHYEGGELVAPPAPPAPTLSRQERIAAIETQHPMSQRAIREAVIVLGEVDARIKSTPVYQRAVTAEALIQPIREEP